ncbi:MAG: DUF5666 domain-containing protein [Terriglobia bacterium]|jgi:hypothetical protein
MPSARLLLALTLAFASGGGFHPALATPAPGAAPAQDNMNFTLEGKITKHSGSKLTLSTEDNIIFHVVYNDKTTIARKDGSAGSAQDLQVGVRIHVDGDLTEAGEVVAQKITILPEPAGEKR